MVLYKFIIIKLYTFWGQHAFGFFILDSVGDMLLGTNVYFIGYERFSGKSPKLDQELYIGKKSLYVIYFLFVIIFHIGLYIFIKTKLYAFCRHANILR